VDDEAVVRRIDNELANPAGECCKKRRRFAQML
jgi:hypothetical protein